MDLTDFKPKSDIIEVILKNPSTDEPLTYDDGTEFSIKVHAGHTKDFKESQQQNIDMWMSKSQKGKKKNPTLAEIESATIEHMARITVEWDFLHDKKKPKLTLDTARSIYSDISWIKDQIQEALEDSVDFTMV
jgi:hypothetical protein